MEVWAHPMLCWAAGRRGSESRYGYVLSYEEDGGRAGKVDIFVRVKARKVASY
jgi:hypothetical protein